MSLSRKRGDYIEVAAMSMKRAQKLDVLLSMAEGATKDGGTGFILFGALQILIGAACAMLTLYIASGSEIAARRGAGGGAAVASGLIVYGVATAYFVAVGVGSMRRRRWAQALSEVVSAMWLAGGAAGARY